MKVIIRKEDKIILVQELAIPPAEYCPAGQAEHDLAPLLKQKLAVQLVQVLADVHVAQDDGHAILDYQIEGEYMYDCT